MAWNFFDLPVSIKSIPVADPEFPIEERAPTLNVGSQTYYFSQYFWKTVWKFFKKIGPGRASLVPICIRCGDLNRSPSF